MARYRTAGRKKARIPRRIIAIVSILAVLIIAGALVTRSVYSRGLKAVSNSQQTQVYTVKSGSTLKQIANDLQDKGIIRSAWAMQLYAHSKELTDSLQAGTYALSPSQDTPSIIKTLSTGQVAKKLITILPGRRIDQVRADLINDGYSPDAVDAALNPAGYSDVPVLSYKPASVTTLEGLLWPDSYEKDQSGSPASVIRESLLAMGEHLTPDVQQAFAAEGLTTYQGVILSSIIVQEVGKPTDQTQVAQVFLSRLKMNMSLGSDVTARYGAIAAGLKPSLTYDSPYNTLKRTGLPPGPISTITANGLSAAARPASTDYLYFVAGDDGTTYFAHTFDEHQANIDKYCHKLCGQ